jgi:hypothetical protein
VSDRDPRAGARRPGRRPPDDGADERARRGASVFGSPTGRQYPETLDQGVHPPPAPGERPWPEWQSPSPYDARTAWQPRWHSTASPPGSADTAAYPPGSSDTAPYPPVGWPPTPSHGYAPPRHRPEGRSGVRSRRASEGQGGAGRRPPAGDPRGDRSPRDGRGGGGGRRGLLGAGLVVGAMGLACFVVGVAVLPWFEAGGQEATLADIRTAFTVSETDPDDLFPDPAESAGAGDQQETADQGGESSGDGDGDLPDTVPSIPSPDEVNDTVEDAVRDEAARVATAAIDSGRARYLELYTNTLWTAAIAAAALGVVFSTVLTPRSTVGALMLGVRSLAGLAVVLAGAAHGAALWVVFGGAGAPSPAFGVWLGVGGLAGVLLACLLGPKR